MSDIFLDALKQLDCKLLLQLIVVYGGSSLLTYINIEFIKYDRAKRGQEKLSRMVLRSLAVGASSFTALIVGWRLIGWPLEQAINHAIGVGMLYPLTMWVLLEYLEAKVPEAYKSLTDNDDATRLPGE